MDGLLSEIQQLFLDAGKDHDGDITLSQIAGLSRTDILHLCKDVINDETNRIVAYIEKKLSKS